MTDTLSTQKPHWQLLTFCYCRPKKKKKGHFCVAAELICFLLWNGIANGDLAWKMTTATDNNHSGLELSVYLQIFKIHKNSLHNESGRPCIPNAACSGIDLGYGYLAASPGLTGMANLHTEMWRDHMCVTPSRPSKRERRGRGGPILDARRVESG